MSEVIDADDITTRHYFPGGSMTVLPLLALKLPSGRVVHFEWHRYCGPNFVRKDGEPWARFPSERHPLWPAFEAWQRQGRRVDEQGNCIWDPEPPLPPRARRRRGEGRIEFLNGEGGEPMSPHRPILCLDMDGVLHSYTSGWQGADQLPDPMTEGAAHFLVRAAQRFRVAIHSSRSCRPGGIPAMQAWLQREMTKALPNDPGAVERTLELIEWPTEKPPALVTIDDRALTFTGDWGDFDLDELAAFKPWNKLGPDRAGLMQRLRRLIYALREAGRAFRAYEAHHRAKGGGAERDEKAERNRSLAELCERALEGLPPLENSALADDAIAAVRDLLGEDGNIAFIDDAVATALRRRDEEIAQLKVLRIYAGLAGALHDVAAFHRACDMPILPTPQIPPQARVALRQELIREEVVRELLPAMERGDLVEIADAMADSIYVIVGGALEYGIPLDRVWAAVQAANMAKVDPATGKVRKRQDGKVLKPNGWSEPPIAQILAEATSE